MVLLCCEMLERGLVVKFLKVTTVCSVSILVGRLYKAILLSLTYIIYAGLIFQNYLLLSFYQNRIIALQEIGLFRTIPWYKSHYIFNILRHLLAEKSDISIPRHQLMT